MSRAIGTLVSSSTLKITSYPRFSFQIHNQFIAFRTFPIHNQVLNPKPTHQILGVYHTGKLGFCVYAENEGKGKSGGADDAEKLARSGCSMPDRLKYLNKEVPGPPMLWIWFVALGFILYAWRAVLFELANWKNAALAVVSFPGHLLKHLLLLIFYFIGDPITSLIRCIETAFNTLQAFYSGIVRYAPVPELTTIIVLASVVLAVAEAAVPNSVSNQRHLLTVAGLIGYAAVRSYISEPFFWTLLLGLYGFSRFIKKRDDLLSALPVVAVLAAIVEPWIRVLAIGSYLALAISHHSKKLSEVKEDAKNVEIDRRVPVPLLCAAFSIGIHLAARWVGYRHLTWMIV